MAATRHPTPLGGMPGFHVFMCPEPDRGGRGQARATMRGCSISGCVHCVFRAFSGSLECVQRRQYKSLHEVQGSTTFAVRATRSAL